LQDAGHSVELQDAGLSVELQDTGLSVEFQDACPSGPLQDAGLSGEVPDSGPSGPLQDAGPSGPFPDSGSSDELQDVGISGLSPDVGPSGSLLDFGPSGLLPNAGLSGELQDGGTSASCPDAGLSASLQNVCHSDELQKACLSASLQNVCHSDELQKAGLSASLPDAGLSASLPDASLSASLPDASLSASLPDAGLSASLPDASLSALLQDLGLSDSLPDAGPSGPHQDVGISLSFPDEGYSGPLQDAGISGEHPNARLSFGFLDAGLSSGGSSVGTDTFGVDSCDPVPRPGFPGPSGEDTGNMASRSRSGGFGTGSNTNISRHFMEDSDPWTWSSGFRAGGHDPRTGRSSTDGPDSDNIEAAFGGGDTGSGPCASGLDGETFAPWPGSSRLASRGSGNIGCGSGTSGIRRGDSWLGRDTSGVSAGESGSGASGISGSGGGDCRREHGASWTSRIAGTTGSGGGGTGSSPGLPGPGYFAGAGNPAGAGSSREEAEDPGKMKADADSPEPAGLARILLDRALLERKNRLFGRVLKYSLPPLAVAVVTLGLLAMTRPGPVYFAVTPDMRMAELVPLDEPLMSKPAVLNWAAETVMRAMSLDFLRWEEKLRDVEPDFSPRAYDTLVASLNESGHIAKLVNKRLNMSAVLTGAPVLTDAKKINGKMTWVINLPLELSYQSSEGVVSKGNVKAEVSVERVSTASRPRGVVISQLVLSRAR
ncbi:MAG: DotI/IcmL/TraM family protein, partial [Deltaproteobacteria bacterium]|nr:DotI/IcmL/TraM family protein [Deltaproteobacteria bacterium]